MPSSNHLTIYPDTGPWLAVTGQVITGRGQRQNVLAKLSMLLIDNEAEFKAEFNLLSHVSMKVHTLSHKYTHTHTHTYIDRVVVQYWTEEVSHIWVINVTSEVSGRGIFDNI